MVRRLKEHSNAIAGIITAGVIMIGYFVCNSLGYSMWSYIVALPALAIILITAIARVNDISKELQSKRWQARRVGLAVSAGASAALLAAPLAGAYMSCGTAALIWGFALTWLTTPGMPPWWRWISGRDEVVDGD